MSSTGDGFSVDLTALRNADQGITDATHGLSHLLPLNGDIEGPWGVGLSSALKQDDGQSLGHDGLASALHAFGDQWDYGLGALVREGNTAQQQLRHALDTYTRADAHVEDQLTQIEQARQDRGADGHQ